ncbi:MAG TPA: dihydrolipoamide acetyltransferase family protein [Candidatus Dormibacteraeota bacterium]|nr:dihydrolipoamide acetyltransferase family protein [Candidatus Dormibacteraeota bacterium]
MAITVTMPQLGESVTEGTIGTWLVKPGDTVHRYDSLVEVITDKVTAEVPSPADGTVAEILAGEGQRLAVGEAICRLDGAEEPTGPVPAAAPAVVAPAPPAAAVAGAEAIASPAAPPPSGPGAGALSPVVRALAAEHGVDLAAVPGTGLQGRVTKRDVLLVVEARQRGGSGPQPAAVAAAGPALGSSPVGVPPAAAPGRGDERIPLTPMRRAIAEHMVRSRQTSPHAWTMVEVDMAGVVAARSAQAAAFRANSGVDLTYLPFAMKATVEGLRQVPAMNATLDGDDLVLHRAVHLGLAVAVDDGLVVPVVREADRYSCAGLAQLAQDLIARARAGKLRMEDLEGGTFTLNNAGALGTVMSQAIINQPQAGILVMDSVIKRPVVVQDAIAIRPVMNLCLSFDHRLNDGAGAGRFLRAVRDWLQAVTPDTSLY